MAESSQGIEPAHYPGRFTLPETSGWYVDHSTNAVVIETDDEHGVAAAVLQLGLDRSALRFEPAVDRTPAATFDTGGQYSSGNNSCSIGFAVEGGFITAGHCAEVGTPVVIDGVRVGRFEQSLYVGADDAFVRLDPGHSVRPYFRSTPVHGSRLAPVGAGVCRVGASSGYHCGVVTSNDASYMTNGALSTGNITTTVCATPGDSGGVLIWGYQAQGISSTTAAFCHQDGPYYSSYSPVNRILDRWGLTLTTEGGNDDNNDGNNNDGNNNDLGGPVQVISGPQSFVNVTSSLCLGVVGGRLQSVQQVCDGGAGQTWTMESVGANVYRVRNEATGGCLDVDGARTAAGTAVNQYGCVGGANQEWQAVSTNGAVYLRGVQSGKCLDVPAGTRQAGAGLQIWHCDDSDNLRWEPTPADNNNDDNNNNDNDDNNNGGGSGPVVVYQHGGFGGASWAIDVGVHGYAAVAASPVGNDQASSIRIPAGYTVRVCQHGDGSGLCREYSSSVGDLSELNDELSYISVARTENDNNNGNNSGGGTEIRSARSGLCVSVVRPGFAVTQEPCDGSTSQRWTVSAVNGGDQFRNVATGACLDIEGGSTTRGAAVGTWGCHGGANQAWVAQSFDGHVQLLNPRSRLCLDVTGGSMSAGQALQVWGCEDSINLAWSVSGMAVVPRYVQG